MFPWLVVRKTEKDPHGTPFIAAAPEYTRSFQVTGKASKPCPDHQRVTESKLNHPVGVASANGTLNVAPHFPCHKNVEKPFLTR